VRQGQQNRRGRGRNNNNNNRKGGHHHNPLARSFESNGPDVKIRGTPAHIAEKYMTLARDAQSSGDPVLAENYLQHAEHYSRIIMAYREQTNPQGEVMNGNGQRMPNEGTDEFGEDDGSEASDDGFPQQSFPPQGQPPARQQEGNRHEGRHEGNNRSDGNRDGNRHDRPFRRDHGRNRDRFNDRNDRGDRGERNQQSEGRQGEGRPPAPERQQEPVAPAAEAGNDPRRRDRFQQPHEQPEFLRRPVRRARVESDEAEKDETSRD
jgi:hypothetical protein